VSVAALDRALTVARDPERLEELRRTGLLDAGAQEPLERLVRIALRMLGAPSGYVSLVDEDRQYFAAAVGHDDQSEAGRQTTLDRSYCKHVVADGELAIRDARADPLTAANPATLDGSVASYLGVPVHGASGRALGSFCVIGDGPRDWKEQDLAVLRDLAEAVETDLRLRLALADNAHQARHDALTGLPNRRALADEAPRGREHGWTRLAVLDLDGFKTYNDTYGHPAGDSLLARLAGRLRDALGDGGRAYRIGGDEFCVLAVDEDVVDRCCAALGERGEDFAIGATCGSVDLDCHDVDDCLRAADQRLYALKRARLGGAGHQATQALAQAIAERDPELAEHLGEVAALAERTARSMGMDAQDVHDVRLAAQLHDIGKVAIPRGILAKAEPLSAEEWGYVRQHPAIGARIVAAAPALSEVSRLVGASHERWDGGGYPQGLRGEEIPLGARIVAVCDAFEALVADRPARPALPRPGAIAELRAGAGTRYDPAVVEAFVAELTPGVTRDA